MRLKKITAGHYKSIDGQVEIQRFISQNSLRGDEICWETTVNGKLLYPASDTKKEAIQAAKYKLLKDAIKN